MAEEITTTTTTTGTAQPAPATTVEHTTVTTTTESAPPPPRVANVNINASDTGGETVTVNVPAVPGTDATVTTSGGSVNINEG